VAPIPRRLAQQGGGRDKGEHGVHIAFAPTKGQDVAVAAASLGLIWSLGLI
jgi:hypothetical protein